MKKIFFLTFCLSVFLSLVFVFSLFTKTEAQNTSSLRPVVNDAGFSFRKDLLPGDTDPDVMELQKILNSSGDTLVSATGAGSNGQESSYFGNLTKLAVIKFQEKYRSEILTPAGLAVGNGNVGFNTRKKLNLFLGVTETLPSVGYPQSRVSPIATITTPSPTTIMKTPVSTVISNNTGLQTPMSTCQFVEFLIGIQAIASNKAGLARQALNCPTPSLTHNFDDDSENNSNSSNFTVTCAPNLPIINLGSYITWTASTTGGTGSYAYSWTGTDALTGNTQSVSHLYMSTSSVGLHNAQVTVTSGSKTASSTCLAAVNSIITSTSSLDIMALPVTVDLKAIPIEPNKYMITWSSEQATSCTAFSSPGVSVWNNQNKPLNGVESLTVSQTGMLRLTCSNSTYSNFEAVTVIFTPPPEEEEEPAPPEEEPISRACNYSGTCYAPINLSFSQDFVFEFIVDLGILPDCWSPSLWLSGSASSPFFELFKHQNGIGFNLAHHIYFTQAVVGGIIEGVDPTESASGYTNLGSLAPGHHKFRVEYSYSTRQVKYFEDGSLIAHLFFDFNGNQSDTLEKLRIPPWFPSIYGYRVGAIISGESLFDLDENPAIGVSTGGCN